MNTLQKTVTSKDGTIIAFEQSGQGTTLVLDGVTPPYPFMNTTSVALANAMPHGQHRTLAGQNHEVEPEAIAPVLMELFTVDAANG